MLPESGDVEPYVIDVGGSTDRAAWVPLAEARYPDLPAAARYALPTPARPTTTAAARNR